MSFNVNKYFSENDSWLISQLKDAEDKGMTKIDLKHKNLFMSESSIGQIYHDKKIKDDDVVVLKKIWQVTSYRREQIEASEFVSNVNTMSYATFETVEDGYYEKMNSIITSTDLHNIVHKESRGLLRVGKYIINSKGYYGIVTKIYVDTVINHKKTRDEKYNPHSVTINDDVVMVDYSHENEGGARVKNGIFPSQSSKLLTEFLNAWAIIEENTIDDLEKKIKNVEANKSLGSYEDKLAIGDGKDTINDDTTAVVSFNSKDQLENMHDKIAIKNNTALVINRSIQRIFSLKKEELDNLMEAKKNELAGVLAHVGEIMAVFKVQMERINRLIVTLELYLGIHENVVQISKGEPAPVDTPIALRQQMLYMDEEFGDPEDGGINHEDIEKFEDWMISTRAFEKIAPEKKCVVILRPRRKEKDYGDIHPILKDKLNKSDKMVYIFIRNGDNIYRIWSDHIPFTDRLFPKKEELGKMVQELINAQQKKNDNDTDSYDYRNADKDLNTAENEIFRYKRMMILLQGIIQRTEIFIPLPSGFNLLDVNTHGNVVQYVYDDENLLMDGKLRFDEWLLGINKGIKKGSRIVFGSAGYDANDWKERFSLSWYHKHSAPPMPNSGEYVVQEKKVPDFKYASELITKEEYELDQKSEKPRYHKDGGNRMSYASGQNDDGKTIYKFDAYLVDENGNRIKEHYIDRQLRISYNPGDDVYPSWSSDDYHMHERKTNITFRINPSSDKFFIHYDACDMEDVEFYVNNRIDRHNYLRMMPVLWSLKKRWKEEKAWENGFIDSLTLELSNQFNINDTTSQNIVKDEIIEAIKWWKNDIVEVWKRPISKDDLKSHRMIKDRVVSMLRKTLKIEASIINNKRTLIFNYTPTQGAYVGGIPFKFIIFGVFKNEFAEMIKLWSKSKFYYDWADKKISMAKINREIAVLESGEYVDLSRNNEGKLVIVKSKGGIPETIVSDETELKNL